jgi:hypothetical protein
MYIVVWRAAATQRRGKHLYGNESRRNNTRSVFYVVRADVITKGQG